MRTKQHGARMPAGEHPKSVEAMLSQLGVYLRTAVYGLDTRPLLKEAASKVFGSAAGMVDMMVRHVPSARKATATKVTQDYSGAVRQGRGMGWDGWGAEAVPHAPACVA